jgi:DNA-binding LacI/PurR family transcriptional regulator
MAPAKRSGAPKAKRAKAAKPPYMRVMLRIRGQVMSGRYTDRLPPERELAAAFSVSYMTLRRAIGELVDEGLLRREVGRGTFVCSPGSLGRRTESLGLVLPPHVRNGIANPFYADVFDGAMRACEASGRTLLVATRAQELVPIDGAVLHPGRKVDGLIGAAIDHGSMPAVLAAARFVPLVLIDAIAGPDVPCVLADNVGASRAAVASLVELGHRRIAYVAGTLAGVGLERLEGYHLALADAGIPFDDRLVCTGNFEFGSGQAAGERLFAMDPRPTAIACANDTMALGVMRAAQAAGVGIPGEVSLIGFDDIAAAAEVTPGLSTVAVPRAALGAAAVRVLGERIADPAAPVPMRTVLPATVVLRGSTAPPRA